VSAPSENQAPIVLETRRLCRELGDEVKTRAVDDVSLQVRSGEFVALTGPSGSGKSTLLYTLGALDRPTSGEILLDGVDIAQLDDDARADLRREKLGFVFQFHFLLPELTVLENVTLPMLRRGDRSRRACRERATEVLTSVGLGSLLDRLPHQLSGGQQQRVSIARAVSSAPRVLLADEPTGNLDSASGRAVIEVFETLCRDHAMTIVMVTHEPGFAARARREIRLRDGKIETSATTSTAQLV
jgi:lipoprotein-releasing system ATP-binding protein